MDMILGWDDQMITSGDIKRLLSEITLLSELGPSTQSFEIYKRFSPFSVLPSPSIHIPNHQREPPSRSSTLPYSLEKPNFLAVHCLEEAVVARAF